MKVSDFHYVLLIDLVVCARENSQTTEFCKRLGFVNPFQPPNTSERVEVKNPEEIELSDSETEDATNSERMEVADHQGREKSEGEKTVGQTEEGVVWSVERRPGLDLPAPTAPDSHMTIEADVESQEKLEDKGDRSSCIDMEVKRSPEHSEVEKVPSGVVIKRRNKDVYKHEEELND